MRPPAPEMGLGPGGLFTDRPRERYLGLTPDSAINSLCDPGPQFPPLYTEGVRPAPGPQSQMPQNPAEWVGPREGGRRPGLRQSCSAALWDLALVQLTCQGGPLSFKSLGF